MNQKNDFQLWICNSFAFPLKEAVKLNLENEVRFGDNASILYHVYFQSSLLIAVSKRLEIAPGYRQAFTLEGYEKEWKSTYQPLLDITLRWKVNKRKWLISNRHRIQYHIRDFEPNVWQYRNRLQIEGRYRLGGLKLTPILFEEIFFREHIGFFENRFAVGGARSLGKKNYKLNLLYMLRNLKSDGHWLHHHVLLLRGHFSF